MRSGQPIPPFLIIVTIFTIGTLLIGSNYFVNTEGAVWSDYDNMKKLVQAIHDGKVNDNSINWQKFRTSDIYHNVSNNTQKCLNLAHKVGDNIADREIVHCSENNKYFKQKYVKVNKTNSTKINGVNGTNNVTSTDTNITGSISDTKATSAYTNATVSRSDSNATGAKDATSSTNATSANSNSAVSSFDTNTTANSNSAVSSFDTNTTANSNSAVSSFDTSNATSANLTK